MIWETEEDIGSLRSKPKIEIVGKDRVSQEQKEYILSSSYRRTYMIKYHLSKSKLRLLIHMLH